MSPNRGPSLLAIGNRRETVSMIRTAQVGEALFWEDGLRLYQGDAVEVMGTIPGESIDMIFADPPYGLSNDGMSVHAGKRVSVNKGEWDRSRGVEADFEFHKEWIVHVAAC